ncbi:MAG: hypothetical protein AAF823_16150 [Planctomycetota bacterium]
MPNDPRGSWSEVVREYELAVYGVPVRAGTTRSVAGRAHDRGLRLAAKRALRHSPVRFDGVQAQAVARGFGEAAEEAGYRVAALAVLPDHAHVVMRWDRKDYKAIARHLKAKATQRLSAEGVHPMAGETGRGGRLPSPWARGCWCPFIDSWDYFERAVKYVEENPVKAGLPRQRWEFVVGAGGRG